VARSYSKYEIRERLIRILENSETGISGARLAQIMGMSRITTTKYLKILALEGTLNQRDMGNLTLWSLEQGQESFTFPDDYFRVSSEYSRILAEGSESEACSLILNSVRSGASAARLVLEVILPASDLISEMYDEGKIGTAEQGLLHSVISRSLQTLERAGTTPEQPDPRRSVVVMAADARSMSTAEITAAAYRAKGWSVFDLGDISSVADVMFDLDFQRLMDRIWKKRQGLMLVAVFSQTAEGLNFFADAISPTRTKLSRDMRLILYSRDVSEKESDTIASADLFSSDLGDILQWSQTVSSNTLR